MIPEGTKNANSAWLALKTDAARADFVESGDAYFHGLISPFVAADIARAFRRLASAPVAPNDDEKRVEELREAVTHLEAEGIAPSLGHLKNRHAFTKEEVQRLAKRFPGKLTVNQGRTGKRGPVSDLVTFLDSPRA